MTRSSPEFGLVAVLSMVISLCGCSRFGSSVRAQSGAPAIEFVGQWGIKGDAPGQLDYPVGIATDTLGNVYVTDEGSQYIHKFDPKGTPLLSFQEDPLKHPQSIAVDFEGIIYVSDPARAGVFIFLPDDEHHHELHLRTRGNAENSISVAVDDDGVIYVLDEKANRVFVYSPGLRLQKSWTPEGPGGSRGPWDSMEVGVDRSVYVADPQGNRLLRFSADGQLLGQLAPALGAGAASAPGTTGGPATTAADPKISDEFAISRDNIFVMDANGTTVHVWTIDGHPKLDVNLAPQLGRERGPAPAIAVSSHKELFVLDTSKSRVLRYRLNL